MSSKKFDHHAAQKRIASSHYPVLALIGYLCAIYLFPAVPARAQALPEEVGTDAEAQSQTTPLTLPQLIEAGLIYNSRIKAEDASLEAARQGVSAARWEYYPTPSVQLESDAKDRVVVGTITQPLYSFGRIKANVDSAQAQLTASEARLDEVRHAIAIRILESYAQFASANRALEATETEQRRLRQLRAMIARRITGGASAPVDLNLIQTRLDQSRAAALELQGRRSGALRELRQLTGLTPKIIIAAAPALPPRFLLDEMTRDDLIAASSNYNPTLRRAGADISLGQAEERQARSALYPTIVARLEHREYTKRYSSNGFPDSRLTVGLQHSIGPGLSARATVKAASARTEAREANFDAMRKEHEAAVFVECEKFTVAREQVALLRQNRNLQEQTLSSYERTFLAGKRTWLDVLNMAREQAVLERELAEVEIRLIMADYRLRIEVGQMP